MKLDFALVLVLLTVISGLITLVDKLFLRQRRSDKAVQNQGAELPREPVLVEYGRSLFPVFLIVLILRSFLFEPFKIPSGSMIPTLQIGDFILVNKYAYGLRLPVTNTKIVSIGDPQRGDVAVFRWPVNPNLNYIKRVIGLPGDTVVYRDKQLFVNGEQVITEEQGLYSQDGVKCYTPNIRDMKHMETLGDVEHNILINQAVPARDGSWVVPEGHYFMVGDNRDNSNDSRAWGFVPEENLVGRAVGIWLNWDLNKGCADWSRIGDGIE